MCQDRTGYMWFATENGLSRFNGNTFLNFPLDSLGIRSFVSSIYVESDDRLYFGTGTDGIFQFDPNSGRATRINAMPVSQSNQLEIFGDTIISLHEYHSLEFISKSTGKMIASDMEFYSEPQTKGLCMTRLKNRSLLVGRTDGLYSVNKCSQKKIELKGMLDNPIYSIWEDVDGSILLGSDGVIFRIRDFSVTDTIHVIDGTELRIRNILTDDQGKIWFNTWGTQQIYTLSGKGIDRVSETLGIRHGSVSRMMVDRDGGIWVGVLRKGVYYFHHRHLFNYPASESFTNSDIRKIVPTSGEWLLLGTDDGLALLNRTTRTITSIKHVPEMTQFTRDFVALNSHEYIAAITDIRLLKPFEKVFDVSERNVQIGRVRYAHASSLWADSSMLLTGNWDNRITFYRLPDFKMIQYIDSVFPGSALKFRINCIFRDTNKKFWIGGRPGLIVLNPGGTKIQPNLPVQQEEVYQIRQVDPDLIEVVTDGGISLFNAHSTALVSKIHVLNTRCSQRIGIDEYLVGTNSGLVYYNNGTSTKLTVSDGLPSDNINDVWYDSDHQVAWIATNEGLMELQLNYLHARAPSVSVDDVQLAANNQSWTGGGTFNFNWTPDPVIIRFTSIHYENPRAVTYQYSLNGESWNPAPSGEIRFASLEPGNHQVQVRAGLMGDYSGKTTTLQLQVIPPFYMTWWFYSLAAVSTLLLGWYVVKNQLRKIRIREEAENKVQQKLIELRQQALASNLNPHFIFNSLNSIQHFINSNSHDSASDYLARFSRLMRMHLDMANLSYIPVSDELKRLEFYLELEKLRFGDKLKWDFKIDITIDAEHILIPNMIIQPFLENAIWHGIMPSGNAGEISLEIEKTADNSIQINISDNGIGMNHPVNVHKQGHESKGTLLISERLSLLDPDEPNPITFSDTGQGTLVTIILSPKMYRLIGSEIPLPHSYRPLPQESGG